MRSSRLHRRRAGVAAVVAVLASPAALAQEPGDYFPLDPGLTWEYRLSITRGEEEWTRLYQAEVVRTEEVAGVPCRVVEKRSDDRLLQTDWFHRDGPVVRHLQRRNTRRHAMRLREPGTDAGRVLLDAAALSEEIEETSWAWEGAGGAEGSVVLEGRESIRLPHLGELDCIVLVDTGEFSTPKQEARQTRRIWLAPGIGIVQEVATYRVGGSETRTEAVLEHLPERH